MLKLTKKQKDMLWGWDWPYSQIDLKFQTRILDDKISRKFIEVEVNINPTTFDICKQNIDDFIGDKVLMQLLMSASYISPEYWYKSCAFIAEDEGNKTLLKAQKAMEHTEKSIIKMHKYVMKFLEIK